MKQRAIRVLQATVLLALVAFCAVFIGYKTGYGIPCPFYAITHLQCPGCGGFRMLLSLLRLDFKSAFYYNALLLISLPLLIVIIIRVIAQYIKTGNTALKKHENIICIVLIAAFIVFGILRNIF